MPGYANRTIRVEFPELTEEGDDLIYVVLRNPKIVPTQDLEPRQPPKQPDGSVNSRDFLGVNYEVVSRLVVDWHVYDATGLDENQRRLDLPATEEALFKLPNRITRKLMDTITEVANSGF